MDDPGWLERAIDLATTNVAAGGGPFGAVVVRDGSLLAEGTNRVTADLDPTAHAEVVAIRRACRSIGDFALAAATLYASCEPCPLCLCSSLWARLDRVVFAADRHQAAAAGFDDAEFHDILVANGDPSSWPTVVTHLPSPRAEEPFDAWRASAGRVDY
jgi:guanine deaminase